MHDLPAHGGLGLVELALQVEDVALFGDGQAPEEWPVAGGEEAGDVVAEPRLADASFGADDHELAGVEQAFDDGVLEGRRVGGVGAGPPDVEEARLVGPFVVLGVQRLEQVVGGGVARAGPVPLLATFALPSGPQLVDALDVGARRQRVLGQRVERRHPVVGVFGHRHPAQKSRASSGTAAAPTTLNGLPSLLPSWNALYVLDGSRLVGRSSTYRMRTR